MIRSQKKRRYKTNEDAVDPSSSVSLPLQPTSIDLLSSAIVGSQGEGGVGVGRRVGSGTRSGSGAGSCHHLKLTVPVCMRVHLCVHVMRIRV